MKLSHLIQTFTIFILFIASNYSASAQAINTLNVESPASIAGEYVLIGADFGSQSTDAIQGSIVFASDEVSPFTDGCTEFDVSVAGKICFIDRGNCEFGLKALNAENAGAIAVVICNTNGGQAVTMGSGNAGNDVSIYTCSISNADCDLIRLELENNEIEISLEYKEEECFLDNELPIVWGINGEGSFDDGIGDWQVSSSNDIDNVFIQTEINSNQGFIRNTTYSIDSPTACRGVLIADFDYFSTQGDSEIFNQLTSPYPQYSGSITSPTIDLSNVENPAVSFYQFYLPLNGFTSFEYSIDNGVTWLENNMIETQNILTAAAESDTLITEQVKLNIDDAAGQSEVKLRFNYHVCDFYFWILDDIIITGNLISSTEELITKNSMKVFPNPASDYIHIQLNKEIVGPFNIKVHNLEGKLVYSEQVNQKTKEIQLSLNNQSSGLYLVSVSSGSAEMIQKIWLK